MTGPKGTSPDDYPGDPLSEDELRRIRRILAADNAWRWLAAGTKNIALWIAAVIGAIVAWKTIFPPK